jgi:hypothetical protein
MSKLKLFLLFFLIIIISFLTLRFSHLAESHSELRYIPEIGESGYVNYVTYLHVENYILMGLLLLVVLYFIISFLYSIFKDKTYGKYFLLIIPFNILLIFLLYNFVKGITYWLDMSGTHIDQFLGYMTLFIGLINLAIFGITFLIIHSIEKKKI